MKTKITIIVLGICYLLAFHYFGFWKHALYGGDSWGYYVHLPSTIIHHDVGDYSISTEYRRKYSPISVDPVAEMHVSPIGKRVDKYPLGVAILESPFFLIAHAYCLLSGTPADGYSPPYMYCVGLSTLIYSILGIWILMLALQHYFRKENIRIAVALAIGLGTNLFYSSTYTVGMSHPYLFFLYTLLLLLVIRFYKNPDNRGAIFIGSTVGFIALTRFPELISALIPLLWGVNSWAACRERFVFLKKHVWKIGLTLLAFLVMLIPQSLYWYFVSGQFWYNGYQGEHFTWTDPKILDGLINYTNGWLVYTPVMSFAILGLFFVRKYAVDAFWPTISFLLIHWYIIYSWWCWYYINGFGSRPMIEVMPLLSFSFAAFITMFYRHSWFKITGVLLAAFFIWLNIFQTWQISEGLLLSDSANRAYYWSIFGKTNSNDDVAIAFYSDETQPNIHRTGIEKLLNGHQDTLSLVQILAENDMEDSTEVQFTNEVKHSGKFGYRCDTEYSSGCAFDPAADQVMAGDYLRISVFGYVRAYEMMYKHDNQASLVVHVYGEDGKTIKYSKLAVSSRINNQDGSIWFTGTPEVWGEASYFVKLPQDLKPSDHIKTYVWNPQSQKLYIDDMKIELWRYQ